MKRGFFIALALFLALSMAACGKKTAAARFRTVYPLQQETVSAALERAGLEGVFSDEAVPDAEDERPWEHKQYVIRSETQTDAGGGRLMVASIAAGSYGDERVLLTVFDQCGAAPQIVWEDWKAQLVFAALLYGGFESEEDVYQAFLEKDTGETHWEAELPGGYCRAAYYCRSQSRDDENGVEAQDRSAFLSVSIYESRALYDALQAGD